MMDALFNLAASPLMPDPRISWLPVGLLLLVGIGFSVGTLVASSLIGPSRTGKVKESAYESGMMPVGNTKQRFNVRFYLVAIMFVAFDVEIVLLYPWATSFAGAMNADPATGNYMLASASVFFVLVLVGYVYDIGRDVLKFD